MENLNSTSLNENSDEKEIFKTKDLNNINSNVTSMKYKFSKVFYSNENYKSHPIREFEPEMTKEQFNSLKNDLSQHNQIFPIILVKDIYEVFWIVDGIKRKNALLECNIEPKYVIFEGTLDEIPDLRKSFQLMRSHYSKDQLACIASLNKYEIKQQNRELLSLKMKNIAFEDENKIDIPEISTSQYLENIYGVSKTYINLADQIKSYDINLFNNVLNGKFLLREAMKSIKALPEKSITNESTNNIELNSISEMKVRELQDLGVSSNKAKNQVLKINEKRNNILQKYKEEETKTIELELPNSINEKLQQIERDENLTTREIILNMIIYYIHNTL